MKGKKIIMEQIKNFYIFPRSTTLSASYLLLKGSSVKFLTASASQNHNYQYSRRTKTVARLSLINSLHFCCTPSAKTAYQRSIFEHEIRSWCLVYSIILLIKTLITNPATTFSRQSHKWREREKETIKSYTTKLGSQKITITKENRDQMWFSIFLSFYGYDNRATSSRCPVLWQRPPFYRVCTTNASRERRMRSKRALK